MKLNINSLLLQPWYATWYLDTLSVSSNENDFGLIFEVIHVIEYWRFHLEFDSIEDVTRAVYFFRWHKKVSSDRTKLIQNLKSFFNVNIYKLWK